MHIWQVSMYHRKTLHFALSPNNSPCNCVGMQNNKSFEIKKTLSNTSSHHTIAIVRTFSVGVHKQIVHNTYLNGCKFSTLVHSYLARSECTACVNNNVKWSTPLTFFFFILECYWVEGEVVDKNLIVVSV